jgi:hypothetical protein
MKVSTPQNARTLERRSRMLSPPEPSVIPPRLMRPPGTSQSAKHSHYHGALRAPKLVNTSPCHRLAASLVVNAEPHVPQFY